MVTPLNQQINNQLPVNRDASITLAPHPVTGDLLMVVGINAVVQAVTDLVQLNHYESPFHPEIGGNVRRLLFELADPTTANLLAEEITDVIQNFEPRASNVNVNVQANGTQGFDVTIIFNVVSNPNPVQIEFFLQRLR